MKGNERNMKRNEWKIDNLSVCAPNKSLPTYWLSKTSVGTPTDLTSLIALSKKLRVHVKLISKFVSRVSVLIPMLTPMLSAWTCYKNYALIPSLFFLRSLFLVKSELKIISSEIIQRELISKKASLFRPKESLFQ